MDETVCKSHLMANKPKLTRTFQKKKKKDAFICSLTQNNRTIAITRIAEKCFIKIPHMKKDSRKCPKIVYCIIQEMIDNYIGAKWWGFDR